MPGKVVPSIAAAILILAGCAPKISIPTKICPGKESVAEALAAWQANSQNVTPFRANGQCLLEYFVEGKTKAQRENLGVKLWVNPPAEIYLQGNKGIYSKAVIAGSNERQFWLTIKPKSIYYWGNWSEQDSSEGPMINPRTLLEALGIGEVDAGQDWSLSNEGVFDVLAKQEGGVTTRKIYIYSCEYQVRRIEFFDRDGQIAATAELDRYKEVSEGFSVPALIKVTTHARNNADDPMSITLALKSMKPAKITEPQRKYLFRLPKTQGFKNVGRIVNGKLIEQPQ